jgi:para-nitrobenzyl esterase
MVGDQLARALVRLADFWGQSQSFTMALGLTGALLAVAAVAETPPEALTMQGVAIGQALDGDVDVWKGLPYAAAPVGALRWRPPAAARAWTGRRNAARFGAACPQDPRVAGDPEPQSEDCLFLKIWAPRHRLSGGSPVMIWIHGGGDVGGAGSQPIYDGAAFAHDGVVMVSINYRLGALGYFAHPALWREPHRSDRDGNYGLMDQIAALKWVRRNIAAFGGDAARVTIAGQSAGGEAILFLLTVPAARGLFARAIAESAPGGIPPRGPAAAQARDIALVKSAGLPSEISAQALRALPPNRLFGDYASAGPYVDGHLIRTWPLDAFKAGQFAGVPMLIGEVSDEASLLGAYAQGADQVLASLGDQADAVRAAYRPDAADEGQFRRELFSDVIFGAPGRRIALINAFRAPSYLYRFDYVTASVRKKVSGAWHLSDVLYQFDTLDRWRYPATDEDKAMTRLVHACWVSFIKGRALCPDGAPWPESGPTRDVTMVFTVAGAHPIEGYRGAQYDAVDAARSRRAR